METNVAFLLLEMKIKSLKDAECDRNVFLKVCLGQATKRKDKLPYASFD